MVSYKTSDAKKQQQRKETETNALVSSRKDKAFPKCIGMFPECIDYKPETPIEERSECRSCPYKGKRK